MGPHDRPVVIGGGAAGLAACLTLEQGGLSPVLVESSQRLGGRLATAELPDGSPVDVGFQVLLTAYPELQRWVDLSAMEKVTFVPGAMVRKDGRWRTLADPRRMPGSVPATAFSGIGTWRDRFRILRLVAGSTRGTPESVQDGRSKGSTHAFLRDEGFSEGFIHDFLRPFFSGIFLDASLSPPPAQFLYTLRMMATGQVVVPAGGMVRLVEALTSGLRRTELRLGQRVAHVLPGAIQQSDGNTVAAGGVIDTRPDVEGADWNACFNAVFECGSRPFGKPIIGLLPDARCVTNLHFMEDVEGARSRGRLNVTALMPKPGTLDRAQMESEVRADLEDAGLDVGPMLWSVEIPNALPKMDGVRSAMPDPRAGEGHYRAGDHTAAPSLDAALRSGRAAAEALLADWGKSAGHEAR